ncbi:MAG TPA: Holliday junction branch migration protein RuvA [Candidatus Wallbacteria bacterium]|nr:Holliday junction branch migration protein RuvA [Candidatus Wallbacteria bacterium]
MIYSIKGILLEKQKEFIVVEAGQIAYEIIFLTSAYGRLPEIGGEVAIYTQFLVREDGYLLFGFLSTEDKKIFNTLLSVPSLGPKTAYNIMNVLPVEKLIEAILKEDEKCLTQVSGVGGKTAKRIILELKDKISKMSQSAKDKGGFAGGAPSSGFACLDSLSEARLALGALGFAYAEIERMLAAISKQLDISSVTTEEILKMALKKR